VYVCICIFVLWLSQRCLYISIDMYVYVNIDKDIYIYIYIDIYIHVYTHCG